MTRATHTNPHTSLTYENVQRKKTKNARAQCTQMSPPDGWISVKTWCASCVRTVRTSQRFNYIINNDHVRGESKNVLGSRRKIQSSFNQTHSNRSTPKYFRLFFLFFLALYDWLICLNSRNIEQFSRTNMVRAVRWIGDRRRVPTIDSDVWSPLHELWGGELFCSSIRCDDRNSTDAIQSSSFAYIFFSWCSEVIGVSNSNSTKFNDFGGLDIAHVHHVNVSVRARKAKCVVDFFFFFAPKMKCSKLISCRKMILAARQNETKSISCALPIQSAITRWKMDQSLVKFKFVTNTHRATNWKRLPLSRQTENRTHSLVVR